MDMQWTHDQIITLNNRMTAVELELQHATTAREQHYGNMNNRLDKQDKLLDEVHKAVVKTDAGILQDMHKRRTDRARVQGAVGVVLALWTALVGVCVAFSDQILWWFKARGG